jgi:hypothetical protein
MEVTMDDAMEVKGRYMTEYMREQVREYLME